jgi:ABC-type multidrug transport system permease subunit
VADKVFLVIERDVRLFFQYKFMIIMRAIWFVSQIVLFGLIASRMVNVSTSTLAQGSANLNPYQTSNSFQINVTSRSNPLLLNASSTTGVGEVQVFYPNGSLATSEPFNSTSGNYTLQLVFNNPVVGLWSVNFVSGGVADNYSLGAFSLLDYFRYYVAGLSIMTLYSAAIFIGFDLYEEAEHGVFEYLLSLPVSRRQLVLGRSIGGGLRAFIYVGPLIALSLYVIGSLNPLGFLVSLIALFLFAFGMSGMSILIAVIIKSSDRFDILMGVMDALIVRLSTAMYPLAVVQATSPFYAGAANFNPVTFAADLFRWGTSVISLDNPLVPFLGVVVFFGFFTFVGMAVYERRIEGGGWQ